MSEENYIATEYWKHGQAKGRKDERAAIRRMIKSELSHYSKGATNGGFICLTDRECAERAQALNDILNWLARRGKRK